MAGLPAADEGTSYTLFLAATDPGRDRIRSWTIDWGDGTVETVDGDVSSVSHLYADDSGGEDYRLTATAYDEDTTAELPYQVTQVAVLDRPLIAFGSAYGANGHLYMLTSGALSWADAQSEAEALGGHLADVADYAEQEFLDESFFGASVLLPGQLWIGLADLDDDGVLEWVTGADMTYSRWGAGGQRSA